MSPTTIVLLICLLMVILFITNKFSYGLITLLCCTLLFLTGACDFSTAFSGISNGMTIMVACMFVVGDAFSRTSLTQKIKEKFENMNAKNGSMLVALLFIFTILLVQFVPAIVALTIVVTFISNLRQDGTVTPSKVLLPVLAVASAWTCLSPVGLGATSFAMDNGLIGGIVPESQLFRLTDYFFVGLPAGIITFVYWLFMYKKLPNTPVDFGERKNTDLSTSYTKMQERIVYVLFAGLFIALLYTSSDYALMSYTYIAPVVVVLILAFTGIMSLKDIVRGLTNPTVWMVAGIYGISTVLSESGASDILGNAILNMLGGTTNVFFITAVFAFVAIIMTTFFSNTGTYMILMPMAASVCLAAGFDARIVCQVISIAVNIAFIFPTGSTSCAFIYGLGHYNPLKMLKYTLPSVILAGIAYVATSIAWFSVMG